MLLLCSAPGAEEDKNHDGDISSYPCLSVKENHITPFKIIELQYTKIDDHPSVYTTL